MQFFLQIRVLTETNYTYVHKNAYSGSIRSFLPRSRPSLPALNLAWYRAGRLSPSAVLGALSLSKGKRQQLVLSAVEGLCWGVEGLT